MDLLLNEVKNFALHKATSDPTGVVAGQLYFNTSTNKLKQYNGSAWADVASGGGGGTPIFVETQVDFSTACTVIDDDMADTLITDTSKPASPQWTYTILSGNMAAHARVTNHQVNFTIGGQNTDASSRTINVIATLNGVEIGTANSATVTAGQYWRANIVLTANPLAAGDVIGYKM